MAPLPEKGDGVPAYRQYGQDGFRSHHIPFVILAVRLLRKDQLTPQRKPHVARLGGLVWKRNQFCRGWLITGDTGSGKTSSGINQLAHQVFQNEPTWGGLCVDEKGVYWETLPAIARHYQREHQLIHLQIRTDDQAEQWMIEPMRRRTQRTFEPMLTPLTAAFTPQSPRSVRTGFKRRPGAKPDRLHFMPTLWWEFPRPIQDYYTLRMF